MQTICMDGQCLNNYLQLVLNGLKIYQVSIKNFKIYIKLIINYDEDRDKG